MAIQCKVAALSCVIFSVLNSTPVAATPPEARSVLADELRFAVPSVDMVPGPSDALDPKSLRDQGSDALMIEVEWTSQSSYRLRSVYLETSGTVALKAGGTIPDPHGSFKAVLIDPQSGETLAYSAVGTGYLYRSYSRGLTFRFPSPDGPVLLKVWAENASSGEMEEVLVEAIDPARVTRVTQALPQGFEVRALKPANLSPRLVINIYADGYSSNRSAQFWTDAAKIVETLRQYGMPYWDHLEFQAVFAPSRDSLARGKDWRRHDTFLGLYFPYWTSRGEPRIVYPTSEDKFRRGIGLIPYDYPIVVIDSSDYWGVGNFNALTAVPSRNSRSAFLLMHEFGHFFGLNEEYDSGGTELKFAPGMREPWSQNMTFNPTSADLKWQHHIDAGTPLPTPRSRWRGNGPIGAYAGGYAGVTRSYKPGYGCAMETGMSFCAVCREAIEWRIQRDLGLLEVKVQ